jgi:hypothetical protein
MKFHHVLLGLAAALFALTASAANVQLAWDASPSPVTNYTVRWQLVGGTNVFTRLVGTNLTVQLTNLSAGQWSVTATATSVQGLESDPSTPLRLDVPAPPVIRLNLQGAARLDGPWESLASISVPLLDQPISFYRGTLEVMR